MVDYSYTCTYDCNATGFVSRVRRYGSLTTLKVEVFGEPAVRGQAMDILSYTFHSYLESNYYHLSGRGVR